MIPFAFLVQIWACPSSLNVAFGPPLILRQPPSQRTRSLGESVTEFKKRNLGHRRRARQAVTAGNAAGQAQHLIAVLF